MKSGRAQSVRQQVKKTLGGRKKAHGLAGSSVERSSDAPSSRPIRISSSAPVSAEIEIRAFKTDAALLEALETGSIDLIAPGAVTPESAAAFAKKRRGVVHLKPSEVLMFLHPDLKNPLLARR